MTVGAFLDAGMSFPLLQKELQKLRVKNVRLSIREEKCGAFRGKKFSVHVKHHHKAHHTSLGEIESRIRKSKLHSRIKQCAIAMFRNLGQAEAKVHGTTIQKIHFHEVGAVDSLMDIVGAAICFYHLKIDKAFVRNITIGRGIHRGHHGRMPIPVPGTYELLKGFSLTQSSQDQEMITPTGATILKTLCSQNGKMPSLKLETIGYGAGDRWLGPTRGFVRVGLGTLSR